MFALLLPSRPLLSATPVSETQFTFTIPPGPSFSHLAIFLLPDASLPPDAGATIWIQLPPASDFRLLGALGPNKPSAIFRLRKGPQNVDDEGDVMLDADPQAQEGAVVLGIQIEPAQRVEAQLAELKAKSAGALVRTGGQAAAGH